jgi:predicted CXXCH cytochrome family protein
MSFRKRATLTVAVIAALAIGAIYRYILSGGLIARQKPPALEVTVARWVLHASVPQKAKTLKNPLSAAADSPDVSAGRELYRQKCEICHAYDGSGKTDTGAGEYPPPLDLRQPEVTNATDGELFYLIRNGIRNTAMPGWEMPDQQTWQLVVFIRNLPKVVSLSASAASPGPSGSAQYVGSSACKNCHGQLYERWSKTRMANVVRDPREHPDAITPDLSKPDPLVKFSKEDIAFVYGSKWKQRYFKKVGDDYFPFPAQWDFTHKMWRPYVVAIGADWWTRYYPTDNFQRPTGPLCDGCHSVNYDISKGTVTEWNVGCEKCHGPGSEHVKQPVRFNIVNPARLDYVQANDVCVQCHSQGQPLKTPTGGKYKYYDWPAGFQVGHKLGDFWKLEPHKLGETSFTHFSDGTAHKNRMQGNDFAISLMYERGVTCFSCHDVHGNDNDALLWKPAKVLCLDCHGPNSPNGPHAPTIEQHTHHKTGSTGSECIACHMPKIEATIADVNVRSHTFRFITPTTTATLKVPNPCNLCHTDKSTEWATAALNGWTDRSPWRMSQ